MVGGGIYAERENPKMGVTRSSMQRNPNIQKPWLGRTRTAAYKLPEEGYIYGCQVPHGLGVADDPDLLCVGPYLHRIWHTIPRMIIHAENVPSEMKKYLGPDYQAMNKLAADMAITTSAEMSQFRKAHPVARLPSKPLNSGKPLPSDKDKNYIYGKPPDKHTSIVDVINNKFGDEWIQMNMHYQKTEPAFDDAGTRRETWKLSHPKMTKSYDLAKVYWAERMADPVPKPRFCMTRFQNVPPRTDCWNDTPLKRDDDDLNDLPPTPPPVEEESTRNFVQLSEKLTRTKEKCSHPSILRES